MCKNTCISCSFDWEVFTFSSIKGTKNCCVILDAAYLYRKFFCILFSFLLSPPSFHIWNSRCNGFNKSMEHLGEGGGRERTEGEIDRRIEGRTKGEPASSLLLRLLSSLSPPLLPFSCSLWNQESFSEVTRRKRRASFSSRLIESISQSVPIKNGVN